MAERKMAWIARIDNIEKHPNADTLDICTVGGWKVVAKLGEYKIGDLAVYCSIDSFVPTTIAPFLTKSGHDPKIYNGIRGERLRTVKLRQVLSQGLLLNLNDVLPQHNFFQDGDDVTQDLNIVKWEAPIPAQLAGEVAGNFPSFIPKTDQERCQNLVDEIQEHANQRFEVTEKLDGSSMTCYFYNGHFGVCSRNWELKFSNANTFWQTAVSLEIQRILTNHSTNIAVQGELIGPGIQGNKYKLSTHKFMIFDIYDIDNFRYLLPEQRRSLVAKLGMEHVPIIWEQYTMSRSVPTILELADGSSRLNTHTKREGLVFKHNSENFTFKAISNKFLLSEN